MHGWPEAQTSRIVTFTTSGDVLTSFAVMLSGWRSFDMMTGCGAPPGGGGGAGLTGLKE